MILHQKNRAVSGRNLQTCLLQQKSFLISVLGLPPYDVEFEDIPAPEQIKFDGSLTPNDWLDRVELLSDKIDKSSIGYLKVRFKSNY